MYVIPYKMYHIPDIISINKQHRKKHIWFYGIMLVVEIETYRRNNKFIIIIMVQWTDGPRNDGPKFKFIY